MPLDKEEIADAIKRASQLAQIRVFRAHQASHCAELLRCLGRVEACAEGIGANTVSRDFWSTLANALAGLRRRLQQGSLASKPLEWPAPPQVEELAQTVLQLRDAVRRLECGEPPGPDGTLESTALLLPDWKTNPAYISFALRATAATMATYIFMSLTNWNGIHTCMITCVVTALTSVEAQVRKQNLRMVGAVIGAIAGMGALLFFLPQHTTLLGLAAVLTVTSFAAAWVAVGPLRVYYAGLQMALAVYYVLLADPHITTELAPIRGRLIGIFVGILAMRAAFVWFAPTHQKRQNIRTCLTPCHGLPTPRTQ